MSFDSSSSSHGCVCVVDHPAWLVYFRRGGEGARVARFSLGERDWFRVLRFFYNRRMYSRVPGV